MSECERRAMTEENEVLGENPVSSYLFNDVFHASIEVYSGPVIKVCGVGGSSGIDPFTFHLCSRCKWVVRFTPRLLYPRRKCPLHQWEIE
jgi:hypothetical protein